MSLTWLTGKSDMGKNKMEKIYSIDGHLLDIEEYPGYNKTKYKHYPDKNSGYKIIPRLYERKEDCCGCYSCFSICAVDAIIMREDIEGFVYPLVDLSKCAGCLQCEKVCPMKVLREE